MAPLAIGSDTGGSIRQPAAFCGVVGLKPTYGRVSRFGLVAFASSLDQLGPMARTAEDAALLLEAMAGHDPRDATSAKLPVPPYGKLVKALRGDFTLGVVRDHFEGGLDPQVASAVWEAIDVFRACGARVRDIDLPHGKYGVATYYIIAPSEASSNLARYDGVHFGYRTEEQAMLQELAEERAHAASNEDDIDSALVRMYRQTRAEGFGPEVKRRLMLGTYALSAGYYDAYYLKALKVRRLIRDDYEAAFRQVDIVIGPTTPSPAFKIGEKVNDPLSMYLQDLYTVTTNLAGITGISLPCGFTSAGLPVGIHLQAPLFEEQRLLQVANMYQQQTEWHAQSPELP
jgi:aspartyl-tRNA(Asn)/glutamyl-tRNA(Gln) amidotransferase subunit A